MPVQVGGPRESTHGTDRGVDGGDDAADGTVGERLSERSRRLGARRRDIAFDMWRYVLGWTLVSAASLAACGGDDDGGSSPGGGGAGTGGTGGSAGVTGGSGSGGSGGSADASTGGTTSSGGAAGGGSDGAAGIGGDAGSDAGLTSRRVFVSSKTYPGNFGGIAKLDVACQSLADAANIGGAWIAWASTSAEPASTRLSHSTVPYVLVGGGEIAKDWADLVDGTLALPIDHDELGQPITGETKVWTGTKADGSFAGGNCLDWAGSAGGVYGTAGATDGTWTFASGNGCANEDRIYCFEQ